MRSLLLLPLLLACHPVEPADDVPGDTDVATTDTGEPAVAPTIAGPGIGAVTFGADELWQVVARVDRSNDVPADDPRVPTLASRPYGTNIAALHDGYFVTVFAADSGGGPGGLLIYDLADPRAPRLVTRVYDPDGTTDEWREAHSLGFSEVDGRKLMALQTGRGVQIWDLTDATAPAPYGRVDLPGVFFGDYTAVAWQLSWQGRHLYVGGSEAGVYVVDTTDPANPVLADRGGLPNPIPPASLGGFRVGPLFAVGNLLYVSSMDNAAGFAVLDIGDPVNPTLISASTRGHDEFYSACLGGGHLVTAQRGAGAKVVLHDVRDPYRVRSLRSAVVVDDQLYCATQDAHVFLGDQDDFTKVDVSDPEHPVVVGSGTLGVEHPDHGQVTVFGNLVYVGNDHGTGSGFLVHQREPDTMPPTIELVSPAPDATLQPVTTRIGVQLSDNVTVESAWRKTFLLRREGGGAVAGRYAAQGNVVSFTPDAPLLPGVTYEIVLAAGGLTDWAGNALAEAFTSRFTTAEVSDGDAIEPLLAHWPLDDGEGTVASDATGQGRHGDLVGGAAFDGDGVALDGVDGAVRIEEPAIPGYDDVTLTLAVRTSSTPSEGPDDASSWASGAYLLDAEDTGRGFALTAHHGKLTFVVGDAAVRSTVRVDDGAWHAVAVVRSGTGAHALVVDGTAVTATAAAPLPSTPKRLTLGREERGGGALDGELRDVRVYGRALSADEQAAVRDGRDEGDHLRLHLDPIASPEVGETVTVRARAAGPGVPQLTFHFGDASGWQDAGTSTSATHAWSAPGHVQVVAVATNGRQRVSAVLPVTVHRPLPASPPRRSSTITVDPARGLVWAVDRDQGTVTAVDADTLGIVHRAGVGDDPRSVAVLPDGEVWVTSWGGDQVVRLDGDDASVIDVVPLGHGAHPAGIVVAPTGGVWVTLEGDGALLRLGEGSGEVLDRIELGAAPAGVSVSGDGGTVWATRLLSPDQGGEVWEIDADAGALVDTLGLPVDTATVDGEDRARGVPNYLRVASPSPDGTSLWVPAKLDNTLRGLARDGLPLDFQSTVRAIVPRIDLSSGAELPGRRLDLNDRSLPSDVAFTPLGDWAIVALEGSDLVEIVDAYTGQQSGALAEPGGAPQGIAVWPDGSRTYVHGLTSRTIVAYDTTGLTAGRSLAPERLGEVVTVAPEEDAMSPVVLRGKTLFYKARDVRTSRDGYISCAVCHLDGAEDGRTWDFTDRGEGLRNTIDLRGRAGVGQGPVHWTANFDEIQDFENDLRGPFGGAGLMSDADFAAGTRSDPLGDPKAGLSSDLDALAAYVASLGDVPASPYREDDGFGTTIAVTGAQHFHDLGCDVCHAGVELTDSGDGLHDVGTITAASGQRRHGPLLGFDTPTLRGVWATAPYLHDGSAPTLRDVLVTRNPGDAHGVTSPLSNRALGELEAYLLQVE